MKKLYSAILFLLVVSFLRGQNPAADYFTIRKAEIDSAILNNYRQVEQFFKEAYNKYPTIPKGILEAIAYSHSRFVHLSPNAANNMPEDIPLTYSIMGLVQDGKGFFRENLPYISRLSGISEKQIMLSADNAILAYAAAYSLLQKQYESDFTDFAQLIPILQELSELPLGDDYWFPRESELYEICSFINNVRYRTVFGITMPVLPMDEIFKDKLPLLKSSRVSLTDASDDYTSEVHEKSGMQRDGSVRGSDYSGARWVAAGSCNYSSRNGTAISSVAIHYTQGTYAGAIAWFQNCSYNGVGSQVSAHYVVRSSDGQITQMVREANKAWHVGSANGYTVGIEHEAYGDIVSYFTPEMYQASADLTRDICRRNQILTHRVFYRDTLDDGTVLNSGLHSLGGATACTKIRGHQHYPSQSHTDPGPHWDWNYYYKLINNETPVATYATASGTFMDSGGDNDNYGDDERKLYLIKVEDADYITLNFREFSLEANYDFLWIYDGSTVFSPLLGRWNTRSPQTVRSSGNALLVEFRSDCATNSAGWIADWEAHVTSHSEDPTVEIVEDPAEDPIGDTYGDETLITRPTTTINCDETVWITDDITISFNDVSSVPIKYRFYQLMGNDGERWIANPQRGFLVDNFDDLNQDMWTICSGNWSENQNKLHQSTTANALIYASLNEQSRTAMLYDFYATYLPISPLISSHFGIYFHAQNLPQNRSITAYKLVVIPNERCIKLYKSNRRVVTELCTFPNVRTNANTSYFYRILHDKEHGIIYCYRDGMLLGQYQDANPLSGSGQYLGLITKSTGATFDNVRAYASRGTQVSVAIGSSILDDAQWQARNGVPKTKIKSIVFDAQMQASTLVEKTLKIDYTAPLLFGQVSDGLGNDLDVTYTNLVAAHWPQAIDPNSDICCYYYNLQVGSVSSNFMKNRLTYDTTFLQTISLRDNTMYIAKVFAQNEAGLCSSPIFSDGFTYRPNSLIFHLKQMSNSDTVQVAIFPNPVKNILNVTISHVENAEDFGRAEQKISVGVRIYNALAQLIYENRFDNLNFQIDVSSFPPGAYLINLIDESQIVFERSKFIKYE